MDLNALRSLSEEDEIIEPAQPTGGAAPGAGGGEPPLPGESGGAPPGLDLGAPPAPPPVS